MRIILIRAVAFSVGVLVFWLAHFLRELFVGVAHGGVPYGPGILRAFWFMGSLTVASCMGVLLGLAAARGATRLVPAWLTVPAGVTFGFFTEPALDILRTNGLPIPQTLLGSLPAVAIIAAVFAWLCAQIVQSPRCRFPAIRNEYHRIKSNRMEMASFLLAASPWLLNPLQILGIPGFG